VLGSGRSASIVTASKSSASSLRCSVESEQVENEDYNTNNISPLNASRLVEFSDESDDSNVEVVGGKRSRSSSMINIVDDSSSEESAEEADEAERGKTHDSTICYRMLTIHITDRLSKDWNAPIYAFFHPVPSIDYVGNPSRRIHVFECNAKSCKGKGFNRRHVRRYLDTADGTSTSNLRRHAKICWGKEAVAAADAAKLHGAAREVVEKSLGMPDGSITAMFERIKGNGIVTYSHKQHTKAEARYALDYLSLSTS